MSLIQTLVPYKTAQWLKSHAESEGLSMAAYIRRLIMVQEKFEVDEASKFYDGDKR